VSCRAAALVMTAFFAVSCGCVGYVPIAPVPISDDVSGYLQASASIQPGHTTRAEVHELLGAPKATSNFWQADLHVIQGAAQWELGAFVMFAPFPMLTRSFWSAHVLIAYDENDRVMEFDSRASRVDTERLPVLQTSGMTFLPGNVMLAGGPRLINYLETPPPPTDCKLIIACDTHADCPLITDIAGIRRFTGFHFFECPSGTCLQGAQRGKYGFVQVPSLHVVVLSAGAHKVVSSERKKAFDATIDCPGGEVRYARIQGEPGTGADARMTTHEQMPEQWSDYRFLVWSGRHGWEETE
jgi:hypothetical protein